MRDRPAPVRPPISATIITKNNAHEIARCLRSLDWVDEILVVDSFSTDGTPAICRQMGARVVQHEFLGFSRQLNLTSELATHDWILNLYADETVSPRLRAEILALFAAGPECDGYAMPRATYLHAKWLKRAGYYPALHVRLFRKSKGRHRDRLVHQKVEVDGKIGRLQGALDHWCWQKNGEFLDNFLEYARREAEQDGAQGPRVRWYHFLLPPYLFFKRFILKRGFLDGTLGIVASARQPLEKLAELMLTWEIQNQAWLDGCSPETAARRDEAGLGGGADAR